MMQFILGFISSWCNSSYSSSYCPMIRYNTALPSSAAVEKLFTAGSDILKAKRSSLNSINFERLVFMRGNLDLLRFKEQEDEE